MTRAGFCGLRKASPVLCFVLLALATSARAQVTGTMSGYIKDHSGAVVPQANVTATLPARGVRVLTHSNAEGFSTSLPCRPAATF